MTGYDCETITYRLFASVGIPPSDKRVSRNEKVMTQISSIKHKSVLYAGWAYLVFVIYGSLVPLDFHDRSWDDAWRAFSNIPYLNLDIGSRADWIANLLLYIPLTFIWSGIFEPRRTSLKILTSIAILSTASALAIGIEFTQLFFPQRTVSLNDIFAEVVGSAVGVVLWRTFGDRITGWLNALRNHGNTAFAAALYLYAIAYLGLSLFPYDFVVSTDELAFKFANNANSFFLSTVSYKSNVRCLVQLLVEMFAVVPLGLILARIKKNSTRSPVPTALLMGALLGVLIEVTQLFMNSGVSQGISVLTRSLGAGIGALAFVHRHELIERAMRFVNSPRKYRLHTLFVTLLYIVGLALMQNWHRSTWQSWDFGMLQLSQVHFLPFYYHYFTTETNALISLGYTLAAYAPIGIIVFAMAGGKSDRGGKVSALLAACTATAFEFLKLFQANAHPDPTNVLIAATAGAVGYLVAAWLVRLATSPATALDTIEEDVAPPLSSVGEPAPTERGRINPLAILSAGILAWAIICYPIASFLLTFGLVAYVFVLRRWPQAWLLVLPAALPVLDLAQWSGRFFFDEFDCLLLATVAVAGWRRPAGKASYRFSSTGFIVLTLFALSVVTAVLVGVYPFPAFDANAFSNYYSPYNALRMGKGLMWALLLIPLLKKELGRNAGKSHRLFAHGMTLGVFATGIAVVWERLAFTGLFNFTDGYRVAGMFSGMHTGGANIEAYLVIALPFVAWWALVTRRGMDRLFGGGVFLLGAYAMAVSYARGGYIALTIGMVIFIIVMLYRRSTSLRPSRAIRGLLLALPVAGIAILLMQGTHIQDRFSTTEHDLHTRVAHWEDAVRMMDDDLPTALFGMGLGRYPATYFWRNTESIHPATYSFKEEDGNTYLALAAGSPLYFEQIVNVRPNLHYQLRFFARSQNADARVLVPICEKWVLYSANCVTQLVKVGNTDGKWQRFTAEFNTRPLAEHHWYASRPIKFSISNPLIGSVVDLDGISLIAADRIELLKNGDFTQGMDHWFFSTDNHQPWHLENVWVQLYFEQGALGMLLFFLLMTYVVSVVALRYEEKAFPAPALAAALAGFMMLGTVDSIFDFPRMSMMFFMLIAWIMLRVRPGSRLGKR